MKMPADALSTSYNSEIQKLNDTLQLLSKVSLSLRTSVEKESIEITRHENHFRTDRGSANRYPDLIAARKLSQRRTGRVMKKWVIKLILRS